MITVTELFNPMANNLFEESDAFVESIDFTIVSKDVENDR